MPIINNTVKKHRRILAVIVFFTSISVAIFIAYGRPRLISDENFPSPFQTHRSSLQGSTLHIGQAGGVPLVQVGFDQNEKNMTLIQGAANFIFVPDTEDISYGVSLESALSTHKRFFGYQYSDATASAEREARLRANNGEPLTFSELFPGTFFTTPQQRNTDSFINDLEAQKDVRFLSLAEVYLRRDSRYVIHTMDDNVVFTVRDIPEHCPTTFEAAQVDNVALRLLYGLNIDGINGITIEDMEEIEAAGTIFNLHQARCFSVGAQELFGDRTSAINIGFYGKKYFQDFSRGDGLYEIFTQEKRLPNTYRNAIQQDLFELAISRFQSMDQFLLYGLYVPGDPTTYHLNVNAFDAFIGFVHESNNPSFEQRVREYQANALDVGRLPIESDQMFDYRRNLLLRLWDRYGIFTHYWNNGDPADVKNVDFFFNLNALRLLEWVLEHNVSNLPQKQIRHIVFLCSNKSNASLHTIWYDCDSGLKTITHELGHTYQYFYAKLSDVFFKPTVGTITDVKDSAFFGRNGLIQPAQHENYAEFASKWQTNSEGLMHYAIIRAVHLNKPHLLQMVLGWINTGGAGSAPNTLRAFRTVTDEDESLSRVLRSQVLEEYSMNILRDNQGRVIEMTLPGGQNIAFTYNASHVMDSLNVRRGSFFLMSQAGNRYGSFPENQMENIDWHGYADAQMRSAFEVQYRVLDPFSNIVSDVQKTSFALANEGKNILQLSATDSHGDQTTGTFVATLYLDAPDIALDPSSPSTTDTEFTDITFLYDGFAFRKKIGPLVPGMNTLEEYFGDLALNRRTFRYNICFGQC